MTLLDTEYKQQLSSYILIAEDDEEDRMLIQEALEESKIKYNVVFKNDGEELCDYLHELQSTNSKYPSIILLDLNMPKKDGKEVIKELKSASDLKQIPVVVLTTSTDEEDIIYTYKHGVNSFITKPISFQELVETMRTLSKYWLQTVMLPSVSHQ